MENLAPFLNERRAKNAKDIHDSKRSSRFFGSQQNDCISADQRNESGTYKARLSSIKRRSESTVFHGKVLLWERT